MRSTLLNTMSDPNSVILATGYSADINYAVEGNNAGKNSLGASGTGYGFASNTITDYKWPGLVSTLTGTLDQKPIIIYRLDGQSRYPQYVLQGGREVELVVEYIPQDNNVLDDMINNVVTTSHTWVLAYKNSSATFGTSTYPCFTFFGCRANQIDIKAAAGDKFVATVTYWCQDVTQGLPSCFSSLSTFASDTGKVPYFFSNESISLNSVPVTRALTLSMTVAHSLVRVYQFGQPMIRAVPATEGSVTGTMNVTFSTADDFNHVLGVETSPSGTLPANASAGAGQSVSASGPAWSLINQGPFVMVVDTVQGKNFTITNLVFQKIPLPAKPEDLVLVDLDFTAYGNPSAITFN
jgi:Phage tail tube protein